MSRVSNTLNMYLILKSQNRVVPGEVLARELGVSKRMLYTYKQDLEMCGVYIETKRGVGGGYYIAEGDLKIS